MKTYEAQELVYRAVKMRGYVDGWQPEQFAARQVAKAAEELGEAAYAVKRIGEDREYTKWKVAQRLAGMVARQAFDNGPIWDDVVMVVLLCAGEALEIDLIAAAAQKAEADIARGVR